jgi:hypothetical protein
MFLQPVAIAGYVTACTFGAAVLGMVLRRGLPDEHLREDSKDVVKLVMGLIATLVALVLGLLIASANGFYTNQQNELQTLSANIVNLDQVLVRYGPETAAARVTLRDVVVAGHDRIWPADGSTATPQVPPSGSTFDVVRDRLLSLAAATDAQRHLVSQAIGIADNISAMRLLIFAQVGNSLSWPFVIILVFWVSVLFLGFGLLGEWNGTVAASLMVGSIAVASATFLILELNQPYSGLLHLSDAPLRQAITMIGR